MFYAVRECQLLAGSIAFNEVKPADVRDILCGRTPPTANLLEEYLLDGLVARLESEIARHAGSPAGSRSGAGLAARAESLLRDRYAEPWTIHRLARALGTNRFRLTTEFRIAVGSGVHKYLVERRVESAERLIETGEKIEVAAYAVGFRSKKTLYEAFKRVRGTRPKPTTQ